MVPGPRAILRTSGYVTAVVVVAFAGPALVRAGGRTARWARVVARDVSPDWQSALADVMGFEAPQHHHGGPGDLLDELLRAAISATSRPR